MGSNSSETPGPRHSKAQPGGWAYNRVSTVIRLQLLPGWMAKFMISKKVKKALKKLTGCEKTKLTDDNKIVLLGSYVRKCNEFVSRIGF